MKHKRETTTARSIDSIHFKLQKPISKDESRKSHHHKKSKRKRWWKNALMFFKRTWTHTHTHARRGGQHGGVEDVHQARARAFRASISGPVYFTESQSGSATPCRSTRRWSSGPLAKAELDIPYLSLRELTMQHQQQQRVSTSSAMPIYLVT